MGDDLKPAEGKDAVVDADDKDADKQGKDGPKSDEPQTSFFRIFSFADGLDYLLMALATFGAMANGAAWPAFAIIFGNFSNLFGGTAGGVPSDFMDQVRLIALWFFVLGLGTLVASFFQASCWILTGNRQTNRLRSKYLGAVLRQDVAFFDTEGTTGGLLQGLNEDSVAVQAAMSEKMGHFIQHMSTFWVGIIVAFSYGWDMTLVMVGCLPFLALVGFMLATVSQKFQAKLQEAYAAASSLCMQAIMQVRTVQAYGGEEVVLSQYSKGLDEPVRVAVKQGLASGLAFGAINAIVYFTYAIAFYYGAWRITQGVYTGGQVLQVLVAALLGGFSLGQAVPVVSVFGTAKTSAGRLFKVIDRIPAIDVEGDGLEPESVQGELELRNLKFAYPARPDVMVFKDFSLLIPAGKEVALVGASGSGKSTVIQLVERFYDPLEGTVLLDGRDIRTLKLTWLRANVGLVSQEPTLFAADILENIQMGRESATREEVEAAARSANAHNFISALPDGYNTHVGERGLQLSGGQKQRIAIARAILKNPRIMLLDEATSALDTASERLVQDALNKMIVGRTTVVVAHRLSTIQNANIIAVVKDGGVVEQGSHHELIQNPDGAYTTLVKLQMKAEADKTEVSSEDSEGEAEVVVVGKGGGEVLPPVAGEMGRRKSSAEHPRAKEGMEDVVALDLEAAPKTAEPGKRRFCGLLAAEEPKPKEVEVPFSRLLAYNKPEKAYLVIGSMAAVAAGAVMPAFAFIISSMINALYIVDSSEKLHRCGFFSGMFVVLGVGNWAVVIIMQYCFGYMGAHLAQRIRDQLFRAIMYQEIAFFDKEENASGILSTRLSQDASYIRGAIGDAVAVILQNTACLCIGYGIAFGYDWQMALVVTGALPLIIIGTLIYYKNLVGAESGTVKLYAKGNQTVTEAFSSIRVIHAYTLRDQVCALYKRLIADASAATSRQSWITGLLIAYSQFSTFSVYGLIIFFGGWQVDNGKASFQDMLMGFLAILLAAMGIAQAQISFPEMGKAKDAVQRVFPIIDRKPLIDASKVEGVVLPSIEGAIELKRVCFVYPTRPSVTVLKDFDLLIPASKQVALVGESGSGKSTIVGLIERFYEPVSGEVLLDGRNIQQYQLKWLRAQIGLVSQEPLLFSCSVLDNIRYGRPDASEAEVVEAAKAANAWEFISGLPEGMNTQVGEKGVQLSGGQKQRVAIARAVLKAPRIMLLDEATSALDAKSEAVVQEALDRLMAGRTSVVVAHRLSTIRHAHVIALVYRGAILEQGSHEELMALHDGGYARLVAAQMGTGGAHGKPGSNAKLPTSKSAATLAADEESSGSSVS